MAPEEQYSKLTLDLHIHASHIYMYIYAHMYTLYIHTCTLGK